MLGESIDVGDAAYRIVGVAPSGFAGVDLERTDIWLPFHRAGMVEEGGTDWVDSRNWYWFHAIARLADGVMPERAEAAATVAHRRGRAEQSEYDPEARVELASLMLARTGQASREARVVPWLMGVALIVLLLTAASMANLLLARGMRRRQDTAVRVALGVSRRRLVGTVIAESIILALAVVPSTAYRVSRAPRSRRSFRSRTLAASATNSACRGWTVCRVRARAEHTFTP